MGFYADHPLFASVGQRIHFNNYVTSGKKSSAIHENKF